MKEIYKSLFTPFKIGNVKIKNRFVMCPMTGTAIINNNEFNYEAEKFYLERAKNGVGLIVTAPSMIFDMWGRGFWLTEAKNAFGTPLRNFVNKIHEEDARVFMQLGVGLGRVIYPKPVEFIKGANIENIKIAASKLRNVWDTSMVHRALTTEEVKTLRDNTILAAKMAKDAGMDGVEIHAVHEGYLLDQFAIESMNSRTDEYGGSLENRMRLACEIIKGIKESCGEDFPVTVRYSVVSKMKGFNDGALPGEDFVEFGRDYEESIAVAKILEEAGCDGLNADNGTYDSWYWAHPPMYMGRACNLEDVSFIKKHVNIPVICAGRMEDHAVSAKAVSEGLIDAVGVARQFLADSAWIEKLKADKEDDIRPCIACHNGCLGSLLQGKGLSCALDPSVMHDEEYKVMRADKAKKVIIVGGGIGGMEAARILTLRGHKASIYEKDSKLGGVFNAAAAPDFKEADKALLAWYEKQMKELGIDVHFGTEVTKDVIEGETPDVVIVASGAAPRKLSFKGEAEGQVVSAIDFLLGNKAVGKNIIVVGGGLTGCEIAYDIARKGGNVTLVEMTDKILAAPLLSAANSNMLRDLMKYHSVEIITSAKITEINGSKAVVECEGKERIISVDNIIVSAGYIPNQQLYEDVKNICDTYIIGDASKVGSLLDAIKAAYKVAMEI